MVPNTAKCNYHTHTTRCMHAQGQDEEYVQAAILGGFDVLGFSDHVPLPFSDGYVSYMRMPMAELPDYLTSVSDLRDRYQGQIRIHTGFEAEYFADYAGHLRRLRDQGVEYLILGQHFADYEDPKAYVGTVCSRDDSQVLHYAEAVVRGIRSGLFCCVAHPDLFMRCRRDDEFTPACERAADMICQAAVEADLPLEFNLLGLRLQMTHMGCGYPSMAFWNAACRWNPRVMLGVDAHSPSLLEDGYLWIKGEQILDELGLRRIAQLPLDD